MRKLVAAGAVVVASVALALVAAPAADAHVKVGASSTSAGGYSVLTFRVPTESETASTVSITVQLPTDHPFTSVSYQPVPGWSAKLVTSKLSKPLKDDDGNAITSAVTQVVWTATDGGLAPGQFGQFPISVGPLPDSGTLFLPTIQKYSDGTEVDWSQQAQGGAEAEHPAPSIRITKAADAQADAAPAENHWPFGFGIAGVVVALLASATAVVALRRARP